jgi:hypothetical protein
MFVDDMDNIFYQPGYRHSRLLYRVQHSLASMLSIFVELLIPQKSN